MFFHLLTHAFFKALLFIATGVAIHRRSNYQDLRRIKGLGVRLGVTKRVVIITKLRLMGAPAFAAFFSKEAVIERIRSRGSVELASYIIIILGVTLTAVYRLRFIFLVIWGPAISQASRVVSEGDNYLYVRMLFLLFPSALSGKLLFFTLAGDLPAVLISSSAKGATVMALVVPAVLLVKVSAQRPSIRGKFFSFI